MAEYGAHIQGGAELSATGSVTLFAAIEGTRIHFQKGVIFTQPANASSDCVFMETDTSGASIAELFHFTAKKLGLEIAIDLGEHGWHATTKGSRVALVQETQNNHVDTAWVGYRR